MWNAMRFIAREYEWVHVGLGVLGNSAFVVGSILFFWDSLQTAGIWLFVIGSAGMLVGSIGDALVGWERRRRDRDKVKSTPQGPRGISETSET
ncbi:MAG: hypothetical protein CMM50_15275 [Rhodospirillaceae bacterium]|nr:hypothetical protein [Rhodospirillaceae bacterium]